PHSKTMTCPNCNSERVRRGGTTTWLVYLILVAIAVPAVLILHLNAAIVAAIMIAVVVVVHLVLNQRVCLECGHQWRS
ncbi:MAG: hypothetical protein M3Q69_08090, partial [Acidobacteriota bacterium]|nr:hypothetical protein [Acidobacteriota bacterium]